MYPTRMIVSDLRIELEATGRISHWRWHGELAQLEAARDVVLSFLSAPLLVRVYEECGEAFDLVWTRDNRTRERVEGRVACGGPHVLVPRAFRYLSRGGAR